MKFIISFSLYITISMILQVSAASVETIFIEPEKPVVIPQHESLYSFPHGQITSEPFRISRFEVSIREAIAYMNSRGKKVTFDVGEEVFWDEPYSNVSFGEAQAICNFYGGRLPNEAEWILAASIKSAPSKCYESLKYGTFYPYPTGTFPINQGGELEACLLKQNDEFDAESAVSELGDVKSSIENINGTSGMLGSVWEWVDAERSYFGKQYKVIKGGSFANHKQQELYDSRVSNFVPAETKISIIGFRCAWDAKKVSQ